MIAFDEDNPGFQAAEKLREELEKINVRSVIVSLIPSNKCESCKDINDLLVYNRDELIKQYSIVENMIKDYIVKYENKKETIAYGE